MVSFEQGFKDTERAAESVRDSARRLALRANALVKAAQKGNIAGVKRAQDTIDEILGALRQEIDNAYASWPFEEDEEVQYIDDEYSAELRRVADEKGLNIYERDGNLISYPSIVRILPGERAVRVDRKKVSDIRPSYLADFLLKNQNKTSSFRSAAFIESLYNVYSDIMSEESSSGRMVGSNGRVVPLSRIYKLLTSLPGSSRNYDRSDFARDLYMLDSGTSKSTRKGAVVSFPSSTGTRHRQSDLFTFIGPDGGSVEYYGIRFSEDG